MIELLRIHEENENQPGEVKPEEDTREKYEVINCHVCEDSGACNSCPRGQQWMIDNPYPGSEKSKRKAKHKV
ncbi:MAG: hypothetical protein WCK10_01380 [Candidatus Staskawiczbacteria bacterium]